MGLFNKKEKAPKEAPVKETKAERRERLEAERAAAKAAKKGGAAKDSGKGKEKAPERPVRKRSESIGSVLKETVPSAVLDLIEDNVPFIIDDSTALVFTVYASDIGGLNAHMKNDADKGQFLKEVEAGSAHLHLDADMIAEDKFILIPDADTLECISEYGFLADDFNRFIPTVVTWDNTGVMTFEEHPGNPKDLQWMLDIMDEKIFLSDEMDSVLPGMGGGTSSSVSGGMGSVTGSVSGGFTNMDDEDDEDDEPFIQPSQTAPKPGAVLSGDGSPAPVRDPFAAMDEEEEEDDEPASPVPSAPDIPEEPDMDDVPDFTQASRHATAPAEGLITCPKCGEPCPPSGCPACGWEPESDFDVEEDVEEEIEDTVLKDVISNVFFKGDLDLEVTTIPFDMQFRTQDRFEPIPENRGDGWLDGYVTQMVKNANAELLALHRENLFKARDQFLHVLQEECPRILDKVAIDGNTPYAEMLIEKAKERDEALAEAVSTIDERRKELEAGWKRELETEKAAAASRAESDYNARNQRAHETALSDVGEQIRSEIYAKYDEDAAGVNELRKSEANRLMSIHVQNTLLTISEAYDVLLEEERRLRARKVDEIQEYIDTHRKEEVARVQTLQAEIRDHSDAAAARREMDERLLDQSRRHEADMKRMAGELDAAARRSKVMKGEYEKRLDEASDLQMKHEEDLSALLEQYGTLEERIRSQMAADYEDRIRTLIEDKHNAEEHLAHVDKIHSKYNRISVVVWISISVMTLLLGVLLGSRFLPDGNGETNYTLKLDAGAKQEAPADPGQAE